MQNKRHILIIPIIHTHADFGSIGSKSQVNQEHETLATQYWQTVSEYVQKLSVDFSELRVYQDGLPDISAEIVTKIVDETQTPNYDLLRWLRNKGAYIMGTEDPPLLLQEYRALQAIFNAKDEEQKQAALEYKKVSAPLLEGRDKYIAQRIKATLPEGSTGILFIGLAHEVKRLLEQEMEVSEPETLIGSSSEALRERVRERFVRKEREQ